MKIHISLAVAVVFFAINSSAQKNTNPTLASQLKSYPQNKKAKVVATRYTSNYSFQLNGQQISVLHEGTQNLISLEGNLSHAEHLYYNDNLKIEETNFRFTSGRNITAPSVCGNYEVESIFYSDAKVCSYGLDFLYEGTEISFSWRTRYNDPRYLTRIFFHDDKPIEEQEISIQIPATISVELVEMNFEGFNIKKTVTKLNDKTVYNYKVNRIEAMKSEDNSLGSSYYYPHLVVVTKEFTTAKGKNKVIGSVQDLYQWYAGLVKEVKNDPAQLNQEVQRLTSSIKEPEAKIKAIYYWIQDNIKYIAFEDGIAGFKPEAAQKVYLNRYGDCKGMANLTKEMLKLAGFDARLTWIGTKRIPYTYDIPSLCVDNHMICTVFLDDDFYILDSTEKYIALGSNAERIQGKEMLIENGDTFIRKTVPEADAAGNLVVRSESLQLNEEQLKGEGELVLNGEAKKNALYLSANVKNEDQTKVFNNLAVSDYSNSDKVELTSTPMLDRDNPLQVKYQYSIGNKVSRFNNDLYIDIDWNKNFQHLKMEDDRLTDYYFQRKLNTKTVKKFKVPAGYSVTHVPKNMSRVFKDFSFHINYSLNGNELLYENIITINNGVIKKQSFQEWNSCIKELKEIYNDPIIITKK